MYEYIEFQFIRPLMCVYNLGAEKPAAGRRHGFLLYGH